MATSANPKIFFLLSTRNHRILLVLFLLTWCTIDNLAAMEIFSLNPKHSSERCLSRLPFPCNKFSPEIPPSPPFSKGAKNAGTRRVPLHHFPEGLIKNPLPPRELLRAYLQGNNPPIKSPQSPFFLAILTRANGIVTLFFSAGSKSFFFV